MNTSEIKNNKVIASILDKFEIDELNAMQLEAYDKIKSGNDVIVLSPTGTGKTLAFLLPLLDRIDADLQEIQLVIIVPTRELAQQIEQVARKMGAGYKINAVYGGRSGSLDRRELEHRPSILIGTPGRIADRLRRDQLNVSSVKTIILDEYDKSLEIGFENEMEEIFEALPAIEQKILTSATSDIATPSFLHLSEVITVDYLSEKVSKLKVQLVVSKKSDKLEALLKVLDHIGPKSGIIFCNFKDALQRISDYLNEHNYDHEQFHGGMEQVDRERSLIKFRNNTTSILLATDLAARGIDISELDYIIHYHLPVHEKEFTHRNGRTARMNGEGIAYVLYHEKENLPDFIQTIDGEKLEADNLKKSPAKKKQSWLTLHINGGRKDKISKGDIAGLFYKIGEISSSQLGAIEVRQTNSFVAVEAGCAQKLIEKLNNTRLKKKKVRISLA